MEVFWNDLKHLVERSAGAERLFTRLFPWLVMEA